MLELKAAMLELKAQKQMACSIPVALVVTHRCSCKAVPRQGSTTGQKWLRLHQVMDHPHPMAAPGP